MTSSPGVQLLVDTRFQGNHGIARYAREVLPRLQSRWTPLLETGRPVTVRDMVALRRLRLPSHALIYTPGFGVGLSRARSLVTLHDLIHVEHGSWRQRLYYERLVRPIIVSAGHVVTVSPTSQRAIARWIDDPRVLVHDAGNGCSPAFGSVGPAHRGPRPHVMFVGNLREHKQSDVAFAAMSGLPDHELIVVVPSAEASHVRERLRSAGLEARTTVLCDIDDDSLASLYRGADLLLFPSTLEGFGLPVLEALSCGTKVVHLEECESVSDICGATQFAVGSRDPREFAEMARHAVQTSASPPDLTRFSWGVVAAKVDLAIAAALDGGPAW